MFLIGLTGGIASGKSTVSKLFADHGIPVIDSDQIARQVVEPGKKAWHEIRRHFGADVFHDDGTLDRQKLGKLIFEDADKRKLLNKITHPKIHKQMIFSVLKCLLQGYQFAVLDIPLLFESGSVIHYVDKIITVYCDDSEQLQRLQKRNDMPEKDAKNRMAAQMPLEKKCQLSDFVIDNNGSMESTKEQTEKVISYLKSLNLHWTNRIRWILLALAVLGFLALVSTGLWFLFTGALKKW